jgi:hypothetical protein
MSIGSHFVTFCLLSTLTAGSAAAQRAVLDDSPSPRQIYELDLELQRHEVVQTMQLLLDDRDDALPPLRGYLPGFDVRLDTRRYIGRQVRIYLRLPTAIPGVDSIGDIELSWQAGGQWQAGSVSPGQEALLFEGMIAEPVTGGVLNLSLAIDAGGTNDFFSIEPIYEIEVIS